MDINKELTEFEMVGIAIIAAALLLCVLVIILSKSQVFRNTIVENFNETVVMPILIQGIEENLDSVTIYSYYGERTKVSLPKYGDITPITEQLIKEDIKEIIEKQFI